MRTTTWSMARRTLTSRTTPLACALSALVMGCGDSGKSGDVAPDTTPDVVDVSEVEPDTTEVSETDVGPDTTPDIAADTTPEVDEEVVLPGELAIAKGDRCGAMTPFATPSLPFGDDGDTASASDDYIYSTGAACGGPGQGVLGDASADLVYSFTPSISATYQIIVTPDGDFDPGVMVTDACPPIGEDAFASLTCVGVSDQGEGTPELLRVELVQGRTYFVLVDGWSNEQPVSGTFSISIAIGEDCDDGRDNDGNDKIDCADIQCADDPRCDEASYAGGCDNNSDDDGDGKTDCADSDCDAATACDEATAGGCDNKIDDEGDGKTDCADPDCADAANCDEATYEGGCDNTLDDDGDGQADCEDSDCGRAAACLSIGETCATAPVLVLDVPAQGTTTGRTSEYGTSAANCNISAGFGDSFGLAAPDAAFAFTPPANGKYLFETVGTFDDALTVTSDCTFGGGTCFGIERGGTGGERLVVDLIAGQAVFVIVDGWSNSSASNSGDFTLTVRKATGSTVELVCDDQSDGDGDGDIDCADSDCAFDRTNCVEVGNCGDGVDNDGDEDVDCDDLDCRSDIVACPPPAGDNCSMPAIVTALDTPTLIDTCDFGVDFLFADNGSCAVPTFDSPDGVVAFTATTAGQYLAQVESDDMDSIVNLIVGDTCPNAAVTTCDAYGDDYGTQRVSFALATGETAWLLVSAYGDDWFEEPGCGTASIRVFEVDPEVCDDELDNDRDDAIDCADPECGLAPNCNEAQSGPGGCSDTVDNDNDRLIDCFDIDCAGSAACPNGIPGDTCAGALVATGEVWSQTVDTCNYGGDFVAEEIGNCQASSGTAPKDIVVGYTAPTTGDYRIVFDPGFGGASSFDALLNVVKGATCPTSPLQSCVAGSDSGDPERVTVSATAGEKLWIVAGGWSSGCGVAQLAVSLIGPEICGDGVDNDADGKTDCADTECAAFPACIEVCTDKIDNDVDGQLDCKDTECALSPFCNEAQNGPNACSDGSDNDADGLSDCYDGDCARSAACPNGAVSDTCLSATRVTTTTWSDTFGTCSYTSDFAQSSVGECKTMGSGGDVVVNFVAPTAGTYRVAYTSGLVSTSTFDSVINVIKSTTCPTTPLTACLTGVDNGASSTAIEALTFVAAAGESFWIMADAYGSGCGVTRLGLSLLADEDCDDGVDNDGDQLTDCADPDCKASEPLLCPTLPGDICGDSALPIATLPFSDSARTTCDYSKDYEADGNDCYDYGSAEVFYRYTATRAISLQASLVSLDVDDVDVVLSALSVCPSAGILTQCLDSADDAEGSPEFVQVSLEAGETVYFVGAPYYSSDCTSYAFELDEVP